MSNDDRLTEITAAYETVMLGHAYTREHFPTLRPGTFVGHTPAKVHEDALDTVLDGVSWLLSEIEQLQAQPQTSRTRNAKRAKHAADKNAAELAAECARLRALVSWIDGACVDLENHAEIRAAINRYWQEQKP